MSHFIAIDAAGGNFAMAHLGKQGTPEVVPFPDGALMRSTAVYIDDRQVLVGNPALNQGYLQPKRLATEWKRFMGTDKTLIETESGNKCLAKDVLAVLLQDAREAAETHLAHPISDVVLTVPANYADDQKAQTKAAAETAGLNVIAMVHEPTAAAYNINLPDRADGVYVIIDFGSTTVDVTAIQVTGNRLDVLTTNGEIDLGGRDFTELARDMAVQAFHSEHGSKPTESDDPTAWHELWERAENAKITLSSADEAMIAVRSQGQGTQKSVTRSEFEAAARPLVDRLLDLLDRTIVETGCPVDAIEDVLLVGGGAHMPLVQRAIAEKLGREPTLHSDPMFAVVKGAAIAGRVTREQQGESVWVGDLRLPPYDLFVRETTAHGVGVVVLGDDDRSLLNATVLPKGSLVPASYTKLFRTADKHQTDVRIELLQGEDGAPKEQCLQLGHFELTGMPKSTNGKDHHPIEIEMNLDSAGMLSARARDLIGGHEADLQIEYRRPTS